MCETPPTVEELAERMRAAKVRAEAVKRRWSRYEVTEEEKNAAEEEFEQALAAYQKARTANRRRRAAEKQEEAG